MRKNVMMDSYRAFTKETPFDFAKRSTIGCGGTARYAFRPKTEAEAFALFRQLQSDRLAYFPMGNLSNVLPPDGETETIVVDMKALRGVSSDKGVYVQAGVTSGLLLQYCLAQGKGGAEFLAGIPCTLGGAIYMNAGVDGGHLSDIVANVTVVEDGKVNILSSTDCAFGYKTSRFMQTGGVIIGARLRLKDYAQTDIRENIKRFVGKRAHLPKGKSMGCIFKNPDGISAGALIEKSGLKGFSMGRAKVSERHANFIINQGATATEIRALIAWIKEKVHETQGIALQEEIRYLP